MKKGDILKFNIYGCPVEGEFVKMEGDLITIKTTKDDRLIINIGKEQTIHEDFLVHSRRFSLR